MSKLYASRGSQIQTIYELLLTGPKTLADFEKAGIKMYKLTARLTDLKHLLEKDGCVLHHASGSTSWEIVFPGGKPVNQEVKIGMHRDESGQMVLG